MSKRVSKKANWFKENTFTPDDVPLPAVGSVPVLSASECVHLYDGCDDPGDSLGPSATAIDCP